MKHVSYCLHAPEDVDDCLRAFQEQCPPQPSALLVSLFTSWMDEAIVLRVLESVRQAFPKAVVVGSTTAGGICHGALSQGSTILHFQAFETARVQALSLDLAETTLEEGAATLVAACGEQESLVAVELLLACTAASVNAFLDGLHELPSELPVFGGVAGWDEAKRSFVLEGQRILRQGIVALFLTGSELHVQVITSQGWSPLGPCFLITAMTAQNVIAALDEQPAKLVYEKYLDLRSEDFVWDNLLFPLLLERNGHALLRLPLSVTEEGGLVMGAECRTGENVRLAYGDPGEILDASGVLHRDMERFAPQGILLFSCVSRRYFLREAVNHEMLPLQDIAPCDGFFTGGEIARLEDGSVPLLNMTLVAVGFREGAAKCAAPHKPTGAGKNALKGAMKLVRHLAHFIAVTSRELEQANVRLVDMAITDRLTGLYNRGEIENILKKELSNRRTVALPLSAIMLDLDDFKKINDVYGHAVGDQTLQWVGETLRHSTRRGDAAGRWGGEEFFIILPGADVNAAMLVAERIRQGLSKGFALPDGKRVTASLGVAEFLESASYMDFYRRLDAALYRAKHEGKNRVCVAE